VDLRRRTTNERPISHRELVRRRSVLILVFTFLCFAGLIARLYCVQVLRHPYYRALADSYHRHSLTLAADRGRIKDRNGLCLATSERGYSVNARRSKIADPAALSRSLAPLLSRSPSWLVRRVEASSRVALLSPWVSTKTARLIWNLELEGIDLHPSYKRVYPMGTLGCHLLGICDTDCRGIEGIELSLNRVLSGRPGRVVGDIEAKAREAGMSFIPDRTVEYVEPKDGRDVCLTIDSQLQGLVEEELSIGLERCRAKSGSCVVMDPANGEILAIAAVPLHDLNDESWRGQERLRLRPVTDLFEPGSTMKPFCLATAWASNALPPGFSYYCRGTKQVGNKTISCVSHAEFRHGHGVESPEAIIVNSCNCGIATIALAVGPEALRAGLATFGFDRRTGLQIRGEPEPLVPSVRELRPITLANIGFGQGIAITPLRLATAYCVFANGGFLVAPRIVKSIEDTASGTREASKPEVVRRVLPERLADQMMDVLVDVVDHGTGKTAALQGYSVAGKTGTAQKAAGGTYKAGSYVSSFVGIVPARAPRVVILVMYDEPSVGRYGSEVAAPVFKRIAEATMKYLKVPPDLEPPDELKDARS
jgi:cell division protein FtsI/penicillin-binding protein 2